MTKTAKFFLALEVFTLILLIILSFFAYPQADDFLFANSLHKFGWLGSQLNWYKTWFGRFSSTMLLISGSYIDFSTLYKVFPVMAIFGYVFAFYLVSKKVFPDISKKFRLIFSLTMLLLYVSGMPSLAQEFYWFTGWATYAPANIATIIFLSYFDSIKNNKIYIALILLGVFVIGSNEVSMLILMILVFILLLKDYKNKRLWQMSAIFVLTSLVVVMAPGNAVRAAKEHDLVLSLLTSAGLTGTLIGIWLLNPLLWISAFLFCRFRQKLNIRIVLPKEKPFFVVLFLLFLIFCAPFIHFWSTGAPAPGRTLNISFFVFIFLFVYVVSLEKIQALMTGILNKKLLIFPVFALWLAGHLYVSSLDSAPKRDFSFYRKNPIEAAK